MSRNSKGSLAWPLEAACDPGAGVRAFSDPGSNLILDFHGDPATAGLAVFSDGNHHMALESAVRAFVDDNPDVGDVFYTTTPPAPLLDALKGDGLAIGNLRITRKPDVFIGPGNILDGLVEDGFMQSHVPFAESRGNVLLVRKGNPKGIASIADLLADDVRLSLSNPVSEKASFVVYREALLGLAEEAGADPAAIEALLSIDHARTVFSSTIHHREVPEILAAGRADVAVIYYHLALRYTRIFPDIFELLPLGGVPDGVRAKANPTTRYSVGTIGDGGQWGDAFASFMQGDKAQQLYESHGLQRLH